MKQDSKSMLAKQSNFVALTADGSDAKAKSAGMAIKAKAVRTKTLAAPKGVTVSLGAQAHEAKVQFRAGKGSATEHRVEGTMDPSKLDSWASLGATMASSLVISGLASGFHSFRVIAVSGDRVSAPSQVVTIFVP